MPAVLKGIEEAKSKGQRGEQLQATVKDLVDKHLRVTPLFPQKYACKKVSHAWAGRNIASTHGGLRSAQCGIACYAAR